MAAEYGKMPYFDLSETVFTIPADAVSQYVSEGVEFLDRLEEDLNLFIEKGQSERAVRGLNQTIRKFRGNTDLVIKTGEGD